MAEELQIGPHASWEEMARAYATIAAGLYKSVPKIDEAVLRIEAAVLVASGAAHDALRAVRILEMRVGGAESAAEAAHDKASEAFKSSHDLERYMMQAAAETGRILDRRAKDPNDRLDSDRAREIAERVVKDAQAAALTEAKIEAYDRLQADKTKRRERLWGIAWKVAGAVATAAALGAGAILWGQCQRAAGRLEGQATTAPATPSPPVVPLPFAPEPTTTPAAPRAMLPDAGKRAP